MIFVWRAQYLIRKIYLRNKTFDVIKSKVTTIFFLIFPKKCRLGPQNSAGSSGPKKLPKIVNCATIKETEKLKETMVGVQVEYVGGHQYPPGSLSYMFVLELSFCLYFSELIWLLLHIYPHILNINMFLGCKIIEYYII